MPLRHGRRTGSVRTLGALVCATIVLWCAPVTESLAADPAPVVMPTTRPLRRRPPPTQPATNAPTTAIPGIAAQEIAVEKIRSIYAMEYADPSYPARRNLARKLIEQGDQTKRDSDAKFVFYREALDVAARAGDVPTAFTTVDHLVAAFPVSRLAHRVEVLQMAEPVLIAPAANASVASMCVDLIDQCAVENDFQHADTLLAIADATAARTQKRAYVSWVQWRRARLNLLRAAHERARPAELTLKTAPDNPDANLIVGRHLCAARGDWDNGLPMLLKATDRPLAALADRDLTCPEDQTVEQFKLAGEWWDFAQRQSEEERLAWRKRAAYWYRRALPELDGLDAATAERRVIESAPPASVKVPRPPDAMPFRGHLYRGSIADVSWDAAVRLCEEAGGQMACLETRLENDYVGKLARGKTLWLGASFDGKGRWRWITNAELFFSYWAHGEPRISDPVGHPQLDASGAWRTSSATAGFVCEWDN
ncbi:hypothetical protein BH09PLA1_BH09PLA1_10650 [soil metagenome]